MQIRRGAEFRNAPIGKLTPERYSELFAILQPGALPIGSAVGWIRQVEQRDRAGACSEALDLEFQAAALFELNSPNAANQVASRTPAFDDENSASGVQGKGVFGDRERVIAGFHQDRLAAGL